LFIYLDKLLFVQSVKHETHSCETRIKESVMDARVRSDHVTGGLGYVIPSQQKAFNYMYEPPPGEPWQNCEYERRDCRIHDARPLASAMSVESTGFELLEAPTGVSNFHDEQQVTGIYYREIEALAKSLVGGTQAVVFDHLLRQREQDRPPLTFGRENANPAAVGRVHNDYTEASGRRRLNLVLSDAAPDLPFMILNFWRPVDHPAIDAPLAVCDARSFPARDWIESDLIYPTRTGEIYLGKYSTSHTWYYYPAMTPEELLVFKTYDSRLDSPARMTPHCAFDDPSTPADTPPRRSIEIRCLVVLD
jgi:hypothetical protein